jgi:hypothetical protein
MGKASLGEASEQLRMSGDEFLDRRLERGLWNFPVSLLQEIDEIFDRGSLRRRKLQNELTEIRGTHDPPE